MCLDDGKRLIAAVEILDLPHLKRPYRFDLRSIKKWKTTTPTAYLKSLTDDGSFGGCLDRFPVQKLAGFLWGQVNAAPVAYDMAKSFAHTDVVNLAIYF